MTAPGRRCSVQHSNPGPSKHPDTSCLLHLRAPEKLGCDLRFRSASVRTSLTPSSVSGCPSLELCHPSLAIYSGGDLLHPSHPFLLFPRVTQSLTSQSFPVAFFRKAGLRVLSQPRKTFPYEEGCFSWPLVPSEWKVRTCCLHCSAMYS